MAKQTGVIKITGTIDDVTFYEMNGEYYARKKSSLTREKVKHHHAFALTRVYNRIMGRASSLASSVYRKIPRAERKHAEFRLLTAKAHALLKAGLSEAHVLKRLREEYPADIRPCESHVKATRRPSENRTLLNNKIPSYRFIFNGELNQIRAGVQLLPVQWNNQSVRLNVPQILLNNPFP